ncbi:hypothetical protein FJQ87_12670 [Shewanella sp. SNU WT4]|uniref:peptidoglycan binding protein CsiV n=1 Tax=Shewanella sp. SNU WT4 TaxID=2590015 RepID=UPI00112A73AB|nr:peptidoglycan binding protein CsiV [Shewanella sp. SNU WT4]QDF67429.1 hypothetical protein FJQ87_12670 [Shewanella sp. SNU WT4]
MLPTPVKSVVMVLLTSMAMGFAPATYAKEAWFEVEVYLFSRNVNANDIQEALPEKAVVPNTSNSLNLKTEAGQAGVHNSNKAYLLAGNGQFSQYINSINRERGTAGLLHLTWRQNMQSRPSSTPIHLFGGRDFTSQYDLMGNKVMAGGDLALDTLTVQDSAQDGPQVQSGAVITAGNGQVINQAEVLPMGIAPQLQPNVWQLDGNLLIYLDHFLYIETNLVLRVEGEKINLQEAVHSFSNQDASVMETSSANPLAFSGSVSGNNAPSAVPSPYLYAVPMKQNRRVRSNELHYFDNPRFGMLIQIRKLN